MRFAICGLGLFVAILTGCQEHQDRVGDLEERLLAPCCLRQSLRDHESPLATQLRAEIRERMAAGESTAQIENAFVQRFGERVLALPAGEDPRWIVGVSGAAAVGIGAVGLGFLLRRRRSSVPPRPRPENPHDSERLDDELAHVD